jgi:hypothetical protein
MGLLLVLELPAFVGPYLSVTETNAASSDNQIISMAVGSSGLLGVPPMLVIHGIMAPACGVLLLLAYTKLFEDAQYRYVMRFIVGIFFFLSGCGAIYIATVILLTGANYAEVAVLACVPRAARRGDLPLSLSLSLSPQRLRTHQRAFPAVASSSSLLLLLASPPTPRRYLVILFNVSALSVNWRVGMGLMVVFIYLMTCLVIDNIYKLSAATNAIFILIYFVLQTLPVLANEQYQRENFVKRESLQKQQATLETEQGKAESLLGQLLPPKIVAQLKSGRTDVADDFQSVTVLFTDMKGFTAYSSQLTPDELVEFLNNMCVGAAALLRLRPRLPCRAMCSVRRAALSGKAIGWL